MGFNFANPRIPLGSWIETFFDWFQNAFDWLITFTNVVIGGMYHGLNLVLSKPLYLVMMVVFAAIGWACANWRVGLFALIGTSSCSCALTQLARCARASGVRLASPLVMRSRYTATITTAKPASMPRPIST